MIRSILTAAGKLKNDIIGIATLSALPESIDLTLSQNMKNALEKVITTEEKRKLNSYLRKANLDLSNLSNREAAILLSFLVDSQTFPDFLEYCQKDNICTRIPEYSGESIEEQYQKKRLTVEQFIQLIIPKLPNMSPNFLSDKERE